ncbi:Transcriptional regulatory protein, variant 2 [Orbilia brochopaga]
MASVAVVFPPSADIAQKGIRTMEDLPMGNTESDRPSPDHSSASPKLSRPHMDVRSPSSSSLSELDSDDSEAETERLNISPQKPAGGNAANSASYSTPKKSIGESTLTSPSRSPSPLSTPGQETPKSPDREMTLGAIEQLTPEGSVAGSPVISPARKRKRGESENLDDEDDEEDRHKDIMEISDLEEDPPKKKPVRDSKSQASEEDEEDEDDEEGEDDEDERKGKKAKRQAAPASGRASDGEEDSGAEDDDESPRPSQRSPEKGKNKLLSVKPSSPRKLSSSKAPETDADEDADEGRDTDAADSTQQVKEDDEADEISRTKRAAADDLATIEILFAQLRDKIVEERVAEIDKEIAMVQDGTHPELILMSQAIETHKKEKIERANILLNFQLETAEQERIANRSAIWSQYHQDIRETREKSFSDANKLWWAIHRERRAADTSVSDYVYKIPKSVSTQVNHRSRYNAEVSLLSGIAKNVGFPAVPPMAAATTDEVRADLEAMGVRRRILSY